MVLCGIAGSVGIRIDEDTREKMLATMSRRGPDGSGCYREGACCLLHRRLAVIDPEGGAQPMGLLLGGEAYWIVYNGELYNTGEIRQSLLRLGHHFSGHSDTEVVLHAYAEYKEQCTELFNGIFAFAVWESGSGRLFLARDRIGVKPLFYVQQPQGLLFASEIKTLLAHPGVSPELDEEGAAQLLLLGPGRLPGSGVFRGIRELEPGCRAFFDLGKLRVTRYWKLRDREHREDFQKTSQKVEFLVRDAILRQMVSDVPIGTFLSGGLDSSIITAVCAEEMRKRGQRLKTFSVDYRDNDRYFQANKFQPNSDGHYIERMSSTFDTDHRGTVLSSDELAAALEEATAARDLPGMADVDFSLLAFCRQVRREVKVALSGECADEIFGGYPWYRDPEIRNSEGFPWAQNLSLRAALLPPPVAEKIHARDFVMDAYRDTCRESDILPGTTAEERRIKELVNLNFRWFMQTLLERKDRMSMNNSLEVRVPFCDYRIAEYLYGVPWEFKDHMGREKGLLRHSVNTLLPEEICYRKKSPYPKTFDPAYGAMMDQRLARVLGDRNSRLRTLVCAAGLEKLLAGENPWPWYGQLMRRPQTVAYFLQLNFWLEHYRVRLLF